MSLQIRFDREILFVGPDAPLEEAALALQSTGGRHLPVLEEGKVLGVVHRSHLDAQGTLVDGAWQSWGTAARARDLLSVVPQLRWTNGERLDALLDALLDHTCAVVIDDEGNLLDLFTDTDGVLEIRSRLGAETLARTIASFPSRTIRPSAPAWAALREMDRCGVRHLVVLDDDQTPIGVVSVRDLETAAVDTGRNLLVGDLIEDQQVWTASEDCSALSAANQMIEHGIGCLPLVDETGFLSGVVNRRDLIRAGLNDG